MDPLTEGLHTGGLVIELLAKILDRADRDRPDKEKNERYEKVQDGFENNLLDDDAFRAFVGELCRQSGRPITPTRDPGAGRRELLHTLLLNSIDLIHERELTKRALNKILKT